MTAPVSVHYVDSLAGDFLSQCCLFFVFVFFLPRLFSKSVVLLINITPLK